MKKRILSLVLCAAMLLSMCLFLGAGVAEDTTADGSAETTETVDGVNIVSFTNAGPLVTPEQNVGPAKVRALAANDTGSGVKLDKMVTGPDDDGNYTVRLEAYATGEQTTTVSTKPCDIVLVLDVSGSMDDYLKETVYTQLNRRSNFNSNNYDKQDNRFVQLDDGTYAKVTIERSGSKQKWTYTYTYKDKNGTVHTATSSGNNTEFTAWTLYYAEQIDSSVKKLDALKSAVNTFIEEVAKKETATVKHNISIVKFAGDKNNEVGDRTYYNYNGDEYNYSQIVKGLTDAKDNQKALKDAVNELNAGGVTRADFGMQHAQSILSKRPADRMDASKVVVMFTDGEPTSGSSFEENVANSAIKASYALKKDGVTVYTVGCMDGANGTPVTDINGVSKVNKYMHLVSSNYKNATSMSNPGDATYPEDTSKSYYLTAKNADDLKNVFESISSQVGGAGNTTLTDESILKDAVTPYFEIPAGAEVTLKTADCTGVNSDGTLKFINEKEITDDSVTATVSRETNTVSVTGFDYSANWCGPRTNAAGSTTYRGQKLIVEFQIKPTADFLGGEGVKTNVGKDDGIYAPEGEKPVEPFTPQQVDVAVRALDVEDASTDIYRGESTDLKDLVSFSEKLNSTNNEYVTTIYTIKDGEQVLGTYTFEPGAMSGTWSGDTTVAPDVTHTYTVTCKVTSQNGKYTESRDATLTVNVNTCSLTITKNVKGEGANPNQTFVFNVKDKDGKLVTTVVLKGNTSTTITGLAVGDYTVVEDTNWSWSYKAEGDGTAKVTLDKDNPDGEAKITNTAKENHWLTSIVDVINKWTSSTTIEKTNVPNK